MNDLIWNMGWIMVLCIALYLIKRRNSKSPKTNTDSKKRNWKKLYQRIRHGRTFDERYEYTVVKCTSLEDIERKHKYMLSTGWIQDGDVIAKYSNVSCWYKRLKNPTVMDLCGIPKSDNIWKDILEVGAKIKELDNLDLKFCDPIPEDLQPFYPLEEDMDNSLPRFYVGPIQTAPNGREQKTFDHKVLDGDITVPEGIKTKDILQIHCALDETDGSDVTIDWKNPEPNVYDGTKFNPFLEDEIGQFDPRGTNWKTRKLNWTEFKVQNPELFDGTANVSSFRIPSYGEDWKLFYGFDPLSSKITTMGEVLNGTLFTEGPDGSVLQYTLRDNIPPNGRYTIYGTVDGRSVIHVTKYEKHD